MNAYKIFSSFSKDDVSAVSLVIANLMPLFGILFWDWSIFNVLILFWTESAIIVFYNSLKVYKISGIKNTPSIILFLLFYGIFMFGHLFFINEIFGEGGPLGEQSTESVRIANIVITIFPAFLSLFISHGILYYTDFIWKKEYLNFKNAGIGIKTVDEQMKKPVKRLMFMQGTIIFGVILVGIFQFNMMALMPLIVFKIDADLKAYKKQYSLPKLILGTSIIVAFIILLSAAGNLIKNKSITNSSHHRVSFSRNNGPCPGTPTVADIDGNIYDTVQIGTQCWIKQNLKVTKNPSGSAITRYCYDNNPAICDTDGGFYSWTTMMNGSAGCNGTGVSQPDCSPVVQGICPSGWHAPSHYEWTLLEKNVGSKPEYFLYDEITTGWRGGDEGANLKAGGSSGFEAILAGKYYSNTGKTRYRSREAVFWSSTEFISGYFAPAGSLAWFRHLSLQEDVLFPSDARVYRNGDSIGMGLSVRCVKN